MALNIKTQEQIYSNLLLNISDDYEKSTGFLTADICKTHAIELDSIYQLISSIANLRLVKDLSGDDLTLRVYDNKGIERRKAISAKVTLELKGTGSINVGDLFSTKNGVQFRSLESKSIATTGTIIAECVQAGIIGNVGANSIIQFPITIQGITNVNNPTPSYDGFEAETDSALKDRYYEALRSPITSGNIYHYLFWSKSVSGVGNAKVFPLWNGENTVKVLIIDNNMKPTSQALVNSVQEYIDPKGVLQNGKWTTWGTGRGQAPIGAYCTVQSANANTINIVVDIDIAQGYTADQCKQSISDKVAEYFSSIAFSPTINYISYAKISQLILETIGILDLRDLTINGTKNNINIAAEEVPTLGTVTTN